MAKISNLKDSVEVHKDCLVQSLGRDYSLGIAKRAYFCTTHKVAFSKIIPIKKGIK